MVLAPCFFENSTIGMGEMNYAMGMAKRRQGWLPIAINPVLSKTQRPFALR